MELHPIASNMTELRIAGHTILFSYSTPVAGYGSRGAFRTDKWYSPTTTRHINKYLGKGVGEVISQEAINKMVERNGQ